MVEPRKRLLTSPTPGIRRMLVDDIELAESCQDGSLGSLSWGQEDAGSGLFKHRSHSVGLEALVPVCPVGLGKVWSFLSRAQGCKVRVQTFWSPKCRVSQNRYGCPSSWVVFNSHEYGNTRRRVAC